jgi:glycerophosphoryl diester phosphodiesterase
MPQGMTRRRVLRAGVALAGGAAALRAADPPLPERGLCAHRGAMSTHPENTLPAFEEAIRLGAHMIEFDVQLTKDRALVLMHDLAVDRTTNGRGKVSELTLAEIKALDAGGRMNPRFVGTCVPTFEETLAMMPRNVWLNCHLKGGAALGEAAARAVARAGRKHQAFLAATAEAATAARAIVPDILVCNMERQSGSTEYAKATIAMKAQFIQLLGKGDVPVEAVKMLNAAGVRVNYFQDETPDGLRRQWKAGVNFPLVNDPAKAIMIAREFGIEPLR